LPLYTSLSRVCKYLAALFLFIILTALKGDKKNETFSERFLPFPDWQYGGQKPD
jgi:hypothetical protein